jgi:predicted DNA-binding mobile mystery protein A
MATRARSLTPLDRKQIDARFSRIREEASLLHTPRGGWLRLVRTALGMSQELLGARLGVTKQAVTDLERREAQGTATLAKLQAAAEALDAELLWVIVPRRPVAETLEARADALARRLAAQVGHSMRLEDQATSPDARAERVAELRAMLLASPELIWSYGDVV